jgi:hypothetical protein
MNWHFIFIINKFHKLRLFIKDEIKSNKLINLYKNEIQQHRAKADVILIKEIFKKLNLTLKDILTMRN